MFTIKIAELNIAIENKYEFVRNVCKGYITENVDIDFSVCVTEEEIKAETESNDSACSDGFAESICIYRQIAERLYDYNAFVLHGAAIDYGGRGYCFTAKSGVGKTTHVLNWKKSFRDKVNFINGDKPIIRLFDGIPCVCGTPWSGKEDLNSKVILPLQAICFIERANDNSITKLETKDALNLILKQIYIPAEHTGMLKTLDLVGNVLTHIDLWKLYCTQNESSAVIAKATMVKED